jgi:hypothetical protein
MAYSVAVSWHLREVAEEYHGTSKNSCVLAKIQTRHLLNTYQSHQCGNQLNQSVTIVTQMLWIWRNNFDA